MDLLDGFFKFIKTNSLSFDSEKPALLALSGGLDSMVLAHLFRRAGFAFGVAHCNFQLRGAESDDDEQWLAKVVQEWAVPFFVKRFDTKDYAARNGLSTQMAARELRYDFFAQTAETEGFGSVATAHHQNDSVETALLNFVRGTSLPGLSGMAAHRAIRPDSTVELVRPLLFATREEIFAYAEAQKITWREDSSNASDDYARNFVRLQVMPRLEELNPNFVDTAARNLRRIRSADENLRFLLQQWLLGDAPVNGTILPLSIDKQRLAQLPSPRQALRQWLKPYGFDAEQTRQIAENLQHVGLRLLSNKGFWVLIEREKIVLSSQEHPQQASVPIQEDDLMLRLPDGSRLFVLSGTSADSGPTAAQVDADKLRFPLHLRHWLPGDSFQPLGMGGKSQKLQDFFTNRKLSRLEKDEVWLLLNGDGAVIWVLGHRLDERFKLGLNTTNALTFNWIA